MPTSPLIPEHSVAAESLYPLSLPAFLFPEAFDDHSSTFCLLSSLFWTLPTNRILWSYLLLWLQSLSRMCAKAQSTGGKGTFILPIHQRMICELFWLLASVNNVAMSSYVLVSVLIHADTVFTAEVPGWVFSRAHKKLLWFWKFSGKLPPIVFSLHQ